MTKSLDYLKDKAIYDYHIRTDSIEICLPGSSITLTDSEDITYLKDIIHEAKRWAVKKQDILNYIEYIACHGGQDMDGRTF